MVKIRNGNKSDRKILVSGLVILTVCFLVCFFHIFDLYSSYCKGINKRFVERMELAEESLGVGLQETMTVLQTARSRFSEGAYAPSEKQIIGLIREAELLGNQGSILYIDRAKTVFGINGIVFDDSFEQELNNINSVKTDLITYVGRAQENVSKDWFLFVLPMGNETNNEEYIVAFINADYYITSEMKINLNQFGSFYLVTEEGNVLGKSEYKDVTVPDPASLINKENLEQSKVLRNHEGEKIITEVRPLESVEGVYLVGAYNQDELLLEKQFILWKSILTCVIIMVLMSSMFVYILYLSRRANSTIEKIAYNDPVTGGKNANFFRDKALHIIADYREIPFLVQRFDIINFRYLNEAYGHNRADEVLKACIQIFNEIFSEKEICVRMDSDQFLALHINNGHVEQQRDAFEEAINQFARSIGIKYPIRFKFGIYQVRKQDKDIDVIIDRANVAKKSLDNDDKKMIAYYSDAIVRDMRKIDKIESEMRKALRDGEFKVYLQPKWDIIQDKIAGAEALVRWIKADGTMVFPNQFVPIFEKNGFIEKLDYYMLETVCKKINELQSLNREVFPISINQSRLLLHNPEYINHVCHMIENYEVPKKLVELELTETVFFDDHDKMIDMMKQLKERGLVIAMDDFGSGYSSLNLLKDISFDVLKIDREFFSESITSESATWILQKVIEMAEGLGIEVVCEGVETKEQVDILKKIGCKKVQGYYYSKPIPMEDFVMLYCGEK